MTTKEMFKALEDRIKILELKVRILELERNSTRTNPHIIPDDTYPRPYDFPEPYQPGTVPSSPYPWYPVIYSFDTATGTFRNNNGLT